MWVTLTDKTERMAFYAKQAESNMIIKQQNQDAYASQVQRFWYYNWVTDRTIRRDLFNERFYLFRVGEILAKYDNREIYEPPSYNSSFYEDNEY